MHHEWSPTVVVRPAHGKALVEDSQHRRRAQASCADLAFEIATGHHTIAKSALSARDTVDNVRLDWIAKGWRPSLEYFEWSEGCDQDSGCCAANAATDSNPTDILPAATGSTEWCWGDAADSELTSPYTLGKVLVHRRTIRDYDPRPLGQAKFARILSDFDTLLENSDTANSLLVGVRFEAIIYAIEDLAPGVWDLDLRSRRATLMTEQDLRSTMSDLMCGMQAPKTASCTIVLVADLQERQRRYPYERALRELYIEVGRVAQWMILAAESHDAGCLITPATNDTVLSDLLGLPSWEVPVYTVTIGRRRHIPVSRRPD